MIPLFLVLWSLSLGVIRRLLIVLPPLKYIWIPCFLPTFFILSLSPFTQGSTIYDFWFTVVPLVLTFGCVLCWCCASLFLLLIFTLLRAQGGYLFLVRTSWRWSSSSFRSWLLELTAFALWCRVFMTLYFAAMGWWLSLCRYKSVCVGFLYTFVFKLPSPLINGNIWPLFPIH